MLDKIEGTDNLFTSLLSRTYISQICFTIIWGMSQKWERYLELLRLVLCCSKGERESNLNARGLKDMGWSLKVAVKGRHQSKMEEKGSLIYLD